MKWILLLLLVFPFVLVAQVQTRPPPVSNDSPVVHPVDGLMEFPDVEAEFPGGAVAMQEFISENVRYPEEAIEANETGKVFLSFVVEPDGSISMIQVERGAAPLLDKEAVRLMRLMPNWKPGQVAGQAVRTRCYLPINFTLTGSEEPEPSIVDNSMYDDANPVDAEALTEVFTAYQKAMLENRGEEVGKYVDKNTLDYYSYILDQALHATYDDLVDLGLLHKFMVVMLRQKASAEEIKKMDASDLLAFVTNKRFITLGNLQESTIAAIKSDGSEAEVYIQEEGEVVPLYFVFHKEGRQWKIDLTTHFDLTENQMVAYMLDNGLDEKRLIEILITESGGQELRPGIWDPVVK